MTSNSKPLFSFGVVTDIQYADKETRKEKYYRDALQKLEECIQYWNQVQPPLEFVVHLGDIIDGNSTSEQTEQDLTKISQPFFKSVPKVHYVLGNHCLTLPREYVTNQLGIKATYYDFVVQNKWRIIVLDGTDISLYGSAKDSTSYIEAQNWLDSHPVGEYPYAKDWNSAIGDEQRSWLKQRLHECKQQNERAIIFCHYPLFAEMGSLEHRLWNGADVVAILEDKVFEGIVCAYFCGHYHPGGYFQHNGIHYMTVKALLEAPPGSNSYAVFHLFDDRLEIQGFGIIQNQTLTFGK